IYLPETPRPGCWEWERGALKRNARPGALVIACAWAGGYCLTTALGGWSADAGAFGVIVGWWLSAYSSAKLRVPVESAFLLGGGYYFAFLAAGLLNLEWFHGDAGTMGWPRLILFGVLQAALFASPVVFDWIFGLAKKGILSRG